MRFRYNAICKKLGFSTTRNFGLYNSKGKIHNYNKEYSLDYFIIVHRLYTYYYYYY